MPWKYGVTLMSFCVPWRIQRGRAYRRWPSPPPLPAFYWPRRFFSVSRLFSYTRTIHYVHLQYMTTGLIHCLPPPFKISGSATAVCSRPRYCRRLVLEVFLLFCNNVTSQTYMLAKCLYTSWKMRLTLVFLVFRFLHFLPHAFVYIKALKHGGVILCSCQWRHCIPCRLYCTLDGACPKK